MVQGGNIMRYILRLIFFLSLVAIITTASILESKYIEQVFNELETDLLTLEAMLEENPDQIDTFENMEEIKALTQTWHKKAKKLKYLVWHTGIKDVEVGLSRIASYTTENNFTEAKVELNNLLDFSRHYSKDFKVLPENVF